jgi:hypothetical protein
MVLVSAVAAESVGMAEVQISLGPWLAGYPAAVRVVVVLAVAGEQFCAPLGRRRERLP